jgi:hypothetical protein
MANSGRSRWAAFGAAVAVCLGAGGLGVVGATISSGSRSVFVQITPCRLVDTRPAPTTVGGRATPLNPGEIATFTVLGANGNCSIPAGATSIASNVTVTAPTSDGFLTLFPADAALPNASNLNWSAGQAPTPNAVTVDLSADGKVKVFNERGTVNVIIDIVGYYEDHNHDDRYYTEAETDTKLANKANATDVYTKAEIDASTANTLIAAGFVAGNGTPFFSSVPIGDWTVTRTGVGNYQVTLTGANVGANCAGNLWPVVNVSTHGGAVGYARVANINNPCPSPNVRLDINTKNVAGADADIDFFFTAYRTPTPGVTPAADDGGAPTCAAADSSACAPSP